MNDYKNKNWLQFLFFVNAAASKQQISEFYQQILRTKPSHHIYFSYRPITACTVVQAVVKATSQSNGKGQILTPWGSETSERISMKPGIYNRVAGMPTHANLRGAATTWVVWANTQKTRVLVS